MRLCRPGIQSELDRFYRDISQDPENFVSISKSAFSQARKKLSPEVFVELTQSQLKYFKENAPYQKSWCGLRIIAIDGSILNLPYNEESKKYFDLLGNSESYGGLMASVSTAYDLTNKLIIDAAIEPYETSEISMAEKHIAKLSQGDVVVMDRGYPSVWLMSLFKKRNIDFCIRLNSTWRGSRELLKEKGECDIDWSIDQNTTKKKPNPKFKEYDLPLKVDGVRLVCFELQDGSRQVLVTSLSREKYNIQKIKELYGMRWQIEENYKYLKHVLEVERFSGKSPIAIQQDFYARIFMANMTSMISSQMTEEELIKKNKTKNGYQINRTQATSNIRNLFIDLFKHQDPYNLLVSIGKALMKGLQQIRPGRTFKRRSRYTIRKNVTYKGL